MRVWLAHAGFWPRLIPAGLLRPASFERAFHERDLSKIEEPERAATCKQDEQVLGKVKLNSDGLYSGCKKGFLYAVALKFLPEIGACSVSFAIVLRSQN